MSHLKIVLSFILFLSFSCSAFAAKPGANTQGPLYFGVQPILGQQKTLETYAPLARFMSKVMGRQVVIKTAHDFSEYWLMVKDNNQFDILMDNGFLTDYRNTQEGWTSIVKVPGLVSYSLITTSDNAVFDSAELVGKKVASMSPPSPAGIFLSMIFDNPMKQPYIIGTDTAASALDMLLTGEVDAINIATPLVNIAMRDGADIAIIETSVQMPHVAISVSPKMSEEERSLLRSALLTMNDDENAQLLKKLGYEKFERADPSLYSGLMQSLEEFSFATTEQLAELN